MSQYSSVSIPGDDLPLSTHHRRELIVDSSIDVEVARERGYSTVGRPESSLKDGHGRDTREQLQAMGFPGWSIRESYYFPGLLIPQYTPTGQRYAGQWKPSRPVPSRDGKPQRYASAKGAARLDVHPRWTRDRGQEDPTLLPAIKDPSMRLVITEGVKKADSLTSRGEVTIALQGVFNWRNVHGTLGDWEDVRIKERECVLVFDSDAITKVAVAQAMQRLGAWLKHKGASKVWYCVVPPAVNGAAVKGVDDFFSAGGSMKELEKNFTHQAPQVTSLEDRFTDTRLAETLAHELLDGYYTWSAGIGWLGWDGKRWAECSEVAVLESVRSWARDHFADAAEKLRKSPDNANTIDVDGWRKVLSASKQETVLKLSRGIVEKRAELFDSDPDIINTPSGIVNLITGDLLPHDPDALCTKMTSGSYVPGFTHEDWEKVLTVLPSDVMEWMRVRMGQAITGHTTSDGVIPILKGGGENGKSLLTTDGVLPALGGYASVASAKLFEKGQHSTEQAGLRGMRFVVAEELSEGRAIDVTALKRVADIGRIRAREVYKNNLEFDSSHSIFGTTNYLPVISETDDGTWRRLVLVNFPYKFVKPGKDITDPDRQRRGDPTLKLRISNNRTGQHDAIVTWIVEGARRWYANMAELEAAVRDERELPASILLPPETVEADTLSWRMEADRVLGFWHQRLEPAPGMYVSLRELAESFNGWLREGGHSPWARDTFRSRFLDHSFTRDMRVESAGRKRTASIVDQIAREPGRECVDLRAQEDLVVGLRWKPV